MIVQTKDNELWWQNETNGTIFNVGNEVAKAMFLHLSVILFTGGSASVHAGIPPDQAPPPEQRRLLLRTVRVLLECILVNLKNGRLTITLSLIFPVRFGDIYQEFVRVYFELIYWQLNWKLYFKGMTD